jgi:hypothetical protein
MAMLSPATEVVCSYLRTAVDNLVAEPLVVRAVENEGCVVWLLMGELTGNFDPSRSTCHHAQPA